MAFNSFHFIAFFVLVWLAGYALRHRVTARNWLLLIASYYFYACWDWRFLSLIVISTGVDFICGRMMSVEESAVGQPPEPSRRRKAILLASLVTNLGLLGFFKYFNFFVDTAIAALARIGVQGHASTLEIILPVGISFYTFQTLSYTIDVYRQKIPTERDLLAFAVYVAFFPQLVAGPIERAAHLLPQFKRAMPINRGLVYSGVYLICWGLFKKVVFADNMAPIVETVFNAKNPNTLKTLFGLYAFAIQIYCDFSGYSDIARGAARCLGFDLMLNFKLPYFATNPSDFWHRWHISLSTWLRDYLYIPLGGNRRGPRRTYINLMLTMLLGGLWHGAALTFVAWGVFHGALLMIHRAIQPWLERVCQFKSPLLKRAWLVTRIVVFFHIVCLSWLLFRADSMEVAWQLLKSFGNYVPMYRDILDIRHYLYGLSGSIVLLFAIQLYQYRKNDLDAIYHLPVWLRGLVYALGALIFMQFGEFGQISFIYFQF